MSLGKVSSTGTDYDSDQSCMDDSDDHTGGNDLCQISCVGCPQGGTYAEKQRVMHAGGDFIDRMTTLGKNLKGDKDLVVPPVVSSNEIIVIKHGKGMSAEAIFEDSAKQL